MRKSFFLPFLLFVVQSTAQVQFQKLSLSEAIQKAAATGKLVYVQLESSTCMQCNDVADIALATKEVADAAAKKFISLKLGPTHPDRNTFIEQYAATNAFGSYFISADGELVHRYPSISSLPANYIEQFDKAYGKPVEGRITLAELNREWNENPMNITAMEANLSKRLSLGLSTDSLLDVYVQRLPKDSFASMRTLVFVLKQAPSLFSKANTKIKSDRNLYIEAWYSLPLTQRVSINNRIAAKSLRVAIAEKSRSKALAVADFHAGTHTDRSSQAARKTYDRKMLDFFIGVKDTSTYLKKAADYYDTYYMSESKEKLLQRDSLARSQAMNNSIFKTVDGSDPKHPEIVRRIDSLEALGKTVKRNLNDQQNASLKKVMDSVINSKDKQPISGRPNEVRRVVTQQSFSYAPITQYYAADLMEGASLLFTSSTEKQYVEKALAWAKRANEAFASPEVMDGYARMLYKTGDQKTAGEIMQKAIEILKQRQHTSVKRFEATLGKMQARASID